MSVRKRAWLTGQGEEKIAWVVDFKDLIGARRLRTFRLKKEADRFATKVRADHLDTELKEKSPARIAVLPSRGSTNPGKEKEMNEKTDTTALRPCEAARKISDVDDLLTTILHLNEAIFMAAAGLGDLNATNAFQAVLNEMENKLLVVRDRLDEIRENLA